MYKLRYYQQEAVDSVFDYFSSHTGNPIIVLPTGAGKSLVIADFIKEVCTRYSGQRILKLTHRKELIEQNHDKIVTYWPEVEAGIYSAGLKRKELAAPVTFAGIQSLARVSPHLIGKIDLIVIDECHLVSPGQSTQYRRLIDKLLEVNPYLKVVGLTATPYRLDAGPLVEGGFFTDICYDRGSLESFNQLVREGFLSRLITKQTHTQVDLSAVHTRGGEFIPKELNATMDQACITEQAVDEIVTLGEGRRAWLIFCSGIDHTEHVAAALRERGIVTAAVHSKMTADRAEVLERFKRGEIQAVTNADVLTTGFDHPEIDLIAMLRPTKSPVIHVQSIGRGLRVAPGKENCLVLDFAGNTERLGPINDIRIASKEEKGKGVAPTKTCPECGSIHPASLMKCTECGFDFPPPASKLKTTASTAAVVAEDQTDVVPVERVSYSLHQKPGKPASLKVTYYYGLNRYQEWICFGHGGSPGGLATSWWRRRTPQERPQDAQEALKKLDDPIFRNFYFAEPTHITVMKDGKYMRVVDYAFSRAAQAG